MGNLEADGFYIQVYADDGIVVTGHFSNVVCDRMQETYIRLLKDGLLDNPTNKTDVILFIKKKKSEGLKEFLLYGRRITLAGSQALGGNLR